MNERIKELAEQADPEHWHKRWYSGIKPRVMDPEIKKFAELIVRECARIASNADLEDVEGGDSAVLRAASEQIKKHFGVE